MKLEKATLAEFDDNNKLVNEIPVQFNPTSLSLQITNVIDPGKAAGRQVRQYIGSSSTTLTLDLIFDTADEGTTDTPRSVREKTETVERFLRPKGQEEKKFVARRVRFHWDELIFDGIVDTVTIAMDHFASSGAPLRAKVSLAIKEQNRDLELLASGPGANRGGNAPTPGSAGSGGLGASVGFSASAGIGIGASASIGIGASASVGVALDGESAADFATRVGVDPAAWRGLQIGGESSLSLSAGVEIGFDTSLSASAGLGVSLGVEAGASSTIETSFGLEPNASVGAVTGVGAGAELASGFALSSAGGVTAAINSVQSAKNQAAEDRTRDAFKAPAKALPASPQGKQASNASSINAPVSAMQPKAPEQERTPLNRTGAGTQTTGPAPRPNRADARASSFGFGVPLRSTVGEAADLRAESINGDVAIKPRRVDGEPPRTSDPTTPSWIALPARDSGRASADRLQRRLRPDQPCSCSGRCKH